MIDLGSDTVVALGLLFGALVPGAVLSSDWAPGRQGDDEEDQVIAVAPIGLSEGFNGICRTGP